jgi:uncharacterized membrane protein YciS (DUF1049 family)
MSDVASIISVGLIVGLLIWMLLMDTRLSNRIRRLERQVDELHMEVATKRKPCKHK